MRFLSNLGKQIKKVDRATFWFELIGTESLLTCQDFEKNVAKGVDVSFLCATHRDSWIT